jgi:hypothetical protein
MTQLLASETNIILTKIRTLLLHNLFQINIIFIHPTQLSLLHNSFWVLYISFIQTYYHNRQTCSKSCMPKSEKSQKKPTKINFYIYLEEIIFLYRFLRIQFYITIYFVFVSWKNLYNFHNIIYQTRSRLTRWTTFLSLS